MASLGTLKGSVEIQTTVAQKSIDNVITKLDKLTAALGALNSLSIDKVTTNVGKLTEGISGLSVSAKTLGNSVTDASKQTEKLGTSVQKAGEQAKGTEEGWGELWSTVQKSFVGTVVFKGIELITNALQTMFNMAMQAGKALWDFGKSSIQLAEDYKRSGVALDIMVAKLPSVGASADEVKLAVNKLDKELKVGFLATSNSMSYLLKSGLNLDTATELLKRFKNEAITGKRASISLADAIENLSFAYMTDNSAIGNLSGMSENWSDITEWGLELLQKEGKLRGLKVGQLNAEQKAMAKLAGTFKVTNLTYGSAEKLMTGLTAAQADYDWGVQKLSSSLGSIFMPIALPFVRVLANMGVKLAEFIDSAKGQEMIARITEKVGQLGASIENWLGQKADQILNGLIEKAIEFVDYLGSPQFQTDLQNIAKTIEDIGKFMGSWWEESMKLRESIFETLGYIKQMSDNAEFLKNKFFQTVPYGKQLESTFNTILKAMKDMGMTDPFATAMRAFIPFWDLIQLALKTLGQPLPKPQPFIGPVQTPTLTPPPKPAPTWTAAPVPIGPQKPAIPQLIPPKITPGFTPGVSVSGGGWYPGKMFATGTNFAPGGMALVGEQGPEIVELPRGAKVHNNAETQRMAGTTQNITFNISGVSNPQAVADLVIKKMASLNANAFRGLNLGY